MDYTLNLDDLKYLAKMIVEYRFIGTFDIEKGDTSKLQICDIALNVKDKKLYLYTDREWILIDDLEDLEEDELENDEDEESTEDEDN